MNLYQITESLMKLQELLEDPEVDQQLVEDCISDYTEELEVKADGYAKVIRNLEANVTAVKAEISRLQNKKKACENGIERLKANLFYSMKQLNKQKVQTDLFTISIQKNGGALPVIVDVPTEDLPDECVIVTEEPNKKALLELLQDPENKEYYSKFAHLGDRGESLRIK